MKALNWFNLIIEEKLERSVKENRKILRFGTLYDDERKEKK